jgi:hypothetical protein
MNLQIGAEVHGTIDGTFDSGYLMTAIVNGQLFRGVMFAPVSNPTGNNIQTIQASSLFLMFPTLGSRLRDLE